MNPIRIAAGIELRQEDDDETWEETGRKIGNFLLATADENNISQVVLEVSDIPEDGDVLIRLPGYITMWIPRWQMEEALKKSRGA